jgi:hypothetical protein
MTDVTLSTLNWNNTLIIVSAAQFDVSHGTDDASGKFIV